MSASVLPLPNAAPVLLAFSSKSIHCEIRLDPAEARRVLAQVTPWPQTAPFIFDSPGLAVHLTLSPEGAQFFREEICEQLNLPLPL